MVVIVLFGLLVAVSLVGYVASLIKDHQRSAAGITARLFAIPERAWQQLRPGEHARVTGVVAHRDGALIAPISGRPCLYWKVIVEARVPACRQYPTGWAYQFQKGAAMDFDVRGPDGDEVRVCVRGVTTLLPEMSYELNSVNEPLDRLSLVDFIDKHWTYRAGSTYRVTELLLEDGQPIHVAGPVELADGEATPVQFTAQPDNPLYVVVA